MVKVKKSKLIDTSKEISANEILKQVEDYEEEKKKFKKQPLGNIKISKSEFDSLKITEEKERKEMEKKLREEKRELEVQKRNKKNDSKINKFKIKFKEKLSKFKIKDIFDLEDKDFIKKFVLTSIISGLVLNYTFFILFHVPFKWYGFPAYGIAFWFILNLLPSWTRKFWERKIN